MISIEIMILFFPLKIDASFHDANIGYTPDYYWAYPVLGLCLYDPVMDGERKADGIGCFPHISLEPFRKGQTSIIFTIFFTFPQTKQADFWLIPVSLSKFTRHFIWVNRKATGPTWNGIIVDIDLHQRFKEDMCIVCSRLPQNPTVYHHFPHFS